MKKTLLILSPIICSIALHNTTTKCMESIIEEPVIFLPLEQLNPDNHVYDNFLDELRNHPKFINTDRPNYDEQIRMQQQIRYPVETISSSSMEDTDLTSSTQEQLNLEISQLMSGKVALTDEEEQEPTKTPNKTGFNWTLRLKSLTHSCPDLLFYTLTNNMFESDNSDHRALLNKAILDCIDNQDNNKLVEILNLTKNKHLNSVTLEEETSQKAYNYLSTIQAAKRTTFIESFEKLNQDQQESCKALIVALQKQYEATTAQTVEIMNQTNSEQTNIRLAFKNNNNNDKKIMSTLRKLSNPSFAAQTNNQSWDYLTKDIPNAVQNMKLTTASLNNGKAAIQSLSAHLLIKDKQ